MLLARLRGVEIVEFDYARSLGRIYRLADIAAARADYTVWREAKDSVDRAVIAIVGDEKFLGAA